MRHIIIVACFGIAGCAPSPDRMRVTDADTFFSEVERMKDRMPAAEYEAFKEVAIGHFGISLREADFVGKDKSKSLDRVISRNTNGKTPQQIMAEYAAYLSKLDDEGKKINDESIKAIEAFKARTGR